MTISYNSAEITITLKTQYHIGSGFGLGRIIDSLLRLDRDGVPVIPGSAISGLTAQGMHDLLNFTCFKNEWAKCCDFHKKPKGTGTEPKHPDSEDSDPGLCLPCKIKKPDEPPCIMCFFFGSTASEAVIKWIDFKCESDKNLLRPMLKSGRYTQEERMQYIKPYFSHKQDMRTHTAKKKHFFNEEEGAGNLQFTGTLLFSEPVSGDRAKLLASAFKNIRAIGRRKSRGKGVCVVKGKFNTNRDACASSSPDKITSSSSLTELVNML